MPKLQRKKIEVTPEASITHLARNVEWKISVESGDPIDAGCISHIHDGEKIFEQLLIWTRNQSAKRATANTVLRYLRYVASLDGAVSKRSLRDFKDQLNTQSFARVNSKAQVYSMCRNFVLHLMEAEVIPTENLPNNFQYIPPAPKQTIIEVAGEAVRAFAVTNINRIESFKAKLGVSKDQAEAIAYGSHILERYHTLSLDRIEAWFVDCQIVDSFLNEVRGRDVANMASITDFRASSDGWKSAKNTTRTLSLAFQILYSKFNRLIPSSNDWPKGIADYCKSKGWPPRRIQSAFFTSAYNLQYFLVAALSHKELAPNVDSVAFYAYTDAFIPSSEKGMMSVHFGKKRGNPVQKELPRRDRLCVAFYSYQKRLKAILEQVPGGQEWLLKENCELFIHFTKSGGTHSIRTFDKSSTSDMVKRVTKELSIQHLEFKPLVAKVTGENFRPTIAALDILLGGKLGELKHKLNHAHLSTTEGYGIRVETQTLHDRKLTDFQNYLISQRKKTLPDTGTGYQCGREEVPTISCGGIEMCFKCEAKRVVLKDKKLIAEWIAFSDWITENKQRLKFNNQERWEQYWQLKLAEYEALLDECTRAEVKAAEPLARNVKIPLMD